MVARELAALGAEYRVFHQRGVQQCRLEWQVDRGVVEGTLSLDGEAIRLADIEGVYLRLMDDRLLPELDGLPADAPAHRHARAFHDALYRWAEIAPGRVVNRSDPQASNGSKPYQAQLIAAFGFQVPETLITNDPEAVLAFARAQGRLIYKSMSGIRSIVQLLGDDDIARLEHISWCPVQFQACIPGTDVRVHTVGDEVFATEIVSDMIDYRYARRNGGTAELRAFELPAEVARKCVALADGLGLAFAGIDLKFTPEGDIYCFEVNPCPAFSYFEANTGQPIARAVARYLAGTGN